MKKTIGFFLFTVFLVACGEAGNGTLVVEFIFLENITPPSAVKVRVNKDQVYEGSLPIPGLSVDPGRHVLGVSFFNDSWVNAPLRIIEIESGEITYISLLLR